MLESVSPFFTVCRVELDLPLEDFATVLDLDFEREDELLLLLLEGVSSWCEERQLE